MHLRPTRFDARDDAPARHRRYRPMEGVQGFTRSHWTPSSGEYSRCIAPADKRVAIRKKLMKKHHTCRPFHWPWRPAGTISSTSPDGGGLGLRRSHWSLSSGDYRDNLCHRSVHCDEIGSIFEGNLWVNTTFACEQHRSVIYQTDQKGLVEMIWDLQGMDKLVVTI